MQPHILRLSALVAARLQRYQLRGKTVTLKVKYSDFKQITRAHSLDQAIDNTTDINAAAMQLLEQVDMQDRKVRLLGVSLSNSGTAIRKGREIRS